MRAIMLTVLGVVLLVACGGRSRTVQDTTKGDLNLVKGKTFEKVYFVPFSQKNVKLDGAHGEGGGVAENKANWFVHLAAGAQRELNKRMKGTQLVIVGSGPSDHGRKVMDKAHVKLEWATAAPAGALTITGRYITAREVSDSARVWGGMMSGKSWTRAHAVIAVGGKMVIEGDVDGKYLGSGWAWGYETFGANEALGGAIVEVLWKIQKGKKVK